MLFISINVYSNIKEESSYLGVFKIGTNIILCTPDNVEVSGNISELIQERDVQDSRW